MELKESIIFGLLATVLVMGLFHLLELTPLGENIAAFGHNTVQEELMDSPLIDRPPLAIVDISSVPVLTSSIAPDPAITGTSRAVLTRLLDKLYQAGAAGVGIDVDFSPPVNSKSGYVLPEDGEFFDHCLGLSNGTVPGSSGRKMPVYLGVGRSVGLSSKFWLGSEEFAPLAAGVDVPREDLSRLASWTEGAGADRLLAMGARLSSLFSVPTRVIPMVDFATRLNIIETSGPDEKFPRFFHSFLVDYRPLKQWLPDPEQALSSTTTAAGSTIIDSQSILNDAKAPVKCGGKIVLLGDVRTPQLRDTFVVPGRERPVPGVLLHACAAITLGRSPLYRFNLFGRIVVDLALSIFLLTIAALVRYGAFIRFSSELSETVVYYSLITALSAVVVWVAIKWVSETRLVWDDYLFVVLGMYLDPRVHHHVHKIYRKTSDILRRRPPERQR